MKVTTRLWTVLTVLLLFAVLVAPIHASGPVTDEPDPGPEARQPARSAHRPPA